VGVQAADVPSAFAEADVSDVWYRDPLPPFMVGDQAWLVDGRPANAAALRQLLAEQFQPVLSVSTTVAVEELAYVPAGSLVEALRVSLLKAATERGASAFGTMTVTVMPDLATDCATVHARTDLRPAGIVVSPPLLDNAPVDSCWSAIQDLVRRMETAPW
jgi:hypothetical protein